MPWGRTNWAPTAEPNGHDGPTAARTTYARTAGADNLFPNPLTYPFAVGSTAPATGPGEHLAATPPRVPPRVPLPYDEPAIASPKCIADKWRGGAVLASPPLSPNANGRGEDRFVLPKSAPNLVDERRGEPSLASPSLLWLPSAPARPRASTSANERGELRLTVPIAALSVGGRGRLRLAEPTTLSAAAAAAWPGAPPSVAHAPSPDSRSKPSLLQLQEYLGHSSKNPPKS